MSDTEVCLSSSKDEEEEDALEFCERGAEIISGKESEVHVFANDFYFLYFSFDLPMLLPSSSAQMVSSLVSNSPYLCLSFRILLMRMIVLTNQSLTLVLTMSPMM